MKKFLPVLIVLFLVGALAQTSSPQLEQLQRDLREQQRIRDSQSAKASRLELDIRSLTSQEKELNARVKALSLRLGKLEAERASTQAQLTKTEEKSQSLTLEIQMLEAKIAYGKEQLSKLMVTLDRERSRRYVKLMVRADNAFDLAVKAKDLDLIQDVNLNVIDELNVNAGLLEGKNRELFAVIAKLNEYQRILERKKAEITQNQAKLKTSIASLQKTRAGRQALQLQAVQSAQVASTRAATIYLNFQAERDRLAEVRRQRALEARRLREEAARLKRLEDARIARIRDEKARARAQQLEEQRNARAQAQIARVTPIFLPISVSNFRASPMPGGSIVADFGVEGDYMAIQGSSGGAVVAVADGVVVKAESLGANFGYSVIISHTDDQAQSLWTIYGNLQYPSVGIDQNVRAGQVIGNVGGGALFPSNELHFQVARNGVNVNPRPYL
jgi:murein DD-endopeptidase MepM/ murein hydrolase activator NlpD